MRGQLTSHPAGMEKKKTTTNRPRGSRICGRWTLEGGAGRDQRIGVGISQYVICDIMHFRALTVNLTRTALFIRVGTTRSGLVSCPAGVDDPGTAASMAKCAGTGKTMMGLRMPLRGALRPEGEVSRGATAPAAAAATAAAFHCSSDLRISSAASCSAVLWLMVVFREG